MTETEYNTKSSEFIRLMNRVDFMVGNYRLALIPAIELEAWLLSEGFYNIEFTGRSIFARRYSARMELGAGIRP